MRFFHHTGKFTGVINDYKFITDLENLVKTGKSACVTGLKGSSLAFVLACLAEKHSGPVLVVTPDLKEAELHVRELSFFTRRPALLFPPYEVFPFSEISPHKSIIARRIETLYRLLSTASESIVVAPIESMGTRLMPKKSLLDFAEYIVAGEDLDRDKLAGKLVAGGYEPTSLVQEIGEFSIRGGIIDLFPPMHANPVRIDSFGDWVESVREFDRLTQRSLKEIEECIILPVREVILGDHEISYALNNIRQYALDRDILLEGVKEIENQIEQKIHFAGSEFMLPVFYPELSSFRDYCSGEILIISTDPSAIGERFADFKNQVKEAAIAVQEESRFSTAPQDLYLIDRNWEAVLPDVNNILITPVSDLADMETGIENRSVHFLTESNQNLKEELQQLYKEDDYLTAISKQVKVWENEGESVHIICKNERNLQSVTNILAEQHIESKVSKSPPACNLTRSVHVQTHLGDLTRGFRFPAYRLVLLSENEFIGDKKERGRISLRKSIAPLLNFSDLKPDDVVVHRDHGIAIYRNLIKLEVGNTVNDYLLLEFRDGDKLYLPVYRLNVLQKYFGVEDRIPQLDKLGGKSWQAAKQKVKEAVWQVAAELLEIYAKRRVDKGMVFSPPDKLFREFEQSFPYEETPNQLAAIEDTLSDMTSPKPMDRLICGEVGYGKTEVALRAAVKAAADCKQAAVLVPTTVLAEQHFRTFSERFSSFPITVACLSRFRTTKEQKEIIGRLAEGKIDIIIGTHRLLQSDIKFKDLGLLIIDEEHRFGVKHKEKFKQIKKTVDVLTLTATPIPRTLQLSLLGIRDLSIIDTPPQDRLAVKTYITKFDDNVVKEAILREYQRGGQVFFVHNRVASINAVAERLRRILPNMRIAIAHGQLSNKSLEDIMVRFVHGEVDVMVCTTIIESGLDIPSVNTIIINRADRLGLAEIHQLRGRVGRSNQQAYAYLLVPSTLHLPRDTQKRLEALLDFSELGSGFKLAMSDLQIRGAGNILGTSQTGHIAAVGYDLYLELLEKTVNELKGLPVEEEFEPDINVDISAYIPEGYMTEPEQRLVTYRRLTMADNAQALVDIKEELLDRYGPFPVELENLFAVIRVKQDLKMLKVRRLDSSNGNLILSFSDKTRISPQAILSLIRKEKNKYHFTPENKLYVKHTRHDKSQVLTEIKNVLQALIQNDNVQV